MALNYVTLTLDLHDGQGNPVITGEALLPLSTLTSTGLRRDPREELERGPGGY